MSPYLLLPLVALVANLGLAVLTLRGHWQAPGHRPFALLLLSTATWGGLLFMMRSSPTLVDAYFWDKLVVVNFVLISVLYLHFTFSFAGLVPFRGLLPFAYGSLVPLAAATFLGWTITGMQLKPYGYAPVLGPAFVPLLVVVYGATAIGMLNLWHAVRHGDSPAIQNRASYVMAGAVAIVIGTVTDILPVLGVPIFPAGVVGNVLFALLATIAMLKGRLMDIRRAGRGAISYIVLVGLVLGAYALISAGVSRMWGAQAGALSVLFAAVGVAMVLRFKDRVQRWVDQSFFRRRYVSLMALERFSEGIRAITDADTFAITLVGLVRKAIGAEFVGLLQPDGTGSGYRLTAASGSDLPLYFPMTAGSTPFTRLARLGRVMFAGEMALLPEWQSLIQPTREALEEAEVEVYVPVITRTELAGVLLLGPREHARRYTQEDVDLLQAVAKQAATGMENARLYQEVQSQLDIGTKRLESFQAAASRLALEENADQTLEQLVEVARELVGARRGAVIVWNAEGEAVKLIGEYPPAVTTDGSGAPALAAWNATSRDPDSSLTVTFKSRDMGQGVFYVEDKLEGGEFTEDDQRLLHLFAVLASVLIDNLRLYAAQSRERSTLTAIQASMTEGLVVLDAKGQVVYFNKAAEELLAVPADAAKGQTFAELISSRSLDLEDPQEAVQALVAVAEGSSGEAGVEVTMLRPQRRDLAVSSFPIALSPDDGMVGILVRDVTEERDLDRRRDTFVSVASHELRTPMTTIMGFTDLLLDEIGENPRQSRWLKYVSEETQRMTEILDDMLDVSRIQSGNVRLTLERLSVAEAVDEVVASLSPTTEVHEFFVDLGSALPKVLVDRSKFSQILVNLLTNAVKYSPEGGRIVVNARHEPRNDRVVISISDEGIGIEEKDLDAVFETFHRVRSPATDAIRGSGLGLYIVKQLVELMGGEVWLESEAGRGSTFFFSAPTARLGIRSGQSVETR